LLKEDLESLESVDPTVIAEGTKAGEKLHASEFSFPAATTTVSPLLEAMSMARVYAEERPGPPKLMLTTAGRCPDVEIQSMAPTIQESEPLPESERTFTP